jgi:integrase
MKVKIHKDCVVPTRKLTDRVVRQKPPETGFVELFDTITPGLALRINAGGRRSYFVMPRVNKKQYKHKLGTTDQLTLAEAREKARDVFRNAANGIAPKDAARRAVREAERAQKNTFRSIAEAYLEDKGKGGGALLRSKDQIVRRLEKDIFPQWGGTPILEITKIDVRELVEGIAHDRPIAANRTLALVNRIFNWACKKDRLDTSPAFGIDPPSVEISRDRVLTDDEIVRLWAGFDKLGHPFNAVFKILLLTAQRRSEVGGIMWSELKGDLWTLPGERTKNSNGNTVPLSPLAKEILDEIPKIEQFEHVFTMARKGDRPVSGWDKIKKRLDKIIAQTVAGEAGEELDTEKHAMDHWTIHDLRRTVRTNLPKLGITPDTAERVLGHTIGRVRGVYDRHAYDEQKRHALEAWARHVETLIGGKPKDNIVEMR